MTESRAMSPYGDSRLDWGGVKMLSISPSHKQTNTNTNTAHNDNIQKLMIADPKLDDIYCEHWTAHHHSLISVIWYNLKNEDSNAHILHCGFKHWIMIIMLWYLLCDITWRTRTAIPTFCIAVSRETAIICFLLRQAIQAKRLPATYLDDICIISWW